MIEEDHGKFDEKEVLKNLKQKPLKRFFKFYIKKRGFLDGRVGLIFSVLYAWVHFLNWAKYWERVYFENENINSQAGSEGGRAAHDTPAHSVSP